MKREVGLGDRDLRRVGILGAVSGSGSSAQKNGLLTVVPRRSRVTSWLRAMSCWWSCCGSGGGWCGGGTVADDDADNDAATSSEVMGWAGMSLV